MVNAISKNVIGKYRVVKSNSKKMMKTKQLIFSIMISTFAIFLLSMSSIVSHASSNESSTKKDIIDEKYNFNVSVGSFSEDDDNFRNLNESDIDNIKKLVESSGIKGEVFVQYRVNFGIPSEKNGVFYINTFSDNFIDKNITKDRIITKKDNLGDKIILDIPIVNELKEDGGYKSDKSIKKEFKVYKLDENSTLANFFEDKEIILSESEFKSIAKEMFPDIKYHDIEKIYINIPTIDGMKTMANILTDNKYNLANIYDFYDDSIIHEEVERKRTIFALSMAFLIVLFILGCVYALSIRKRR